MVTITAPAAVPDAATVEAFRRRLNGPLLRPGTPGSPTRPGSGTAADEGDERIRATYGADYDRLAATKHAYDPDYLFHSNRNIRPRSA